MLSFIRKPLFISSGILVISILFFTFGLYFFLHPKVLKSNGTIVSNNGNFEYNNVTKGVKMNYPADWIKKDYDGALMVEFKKDADWDLNIVNESLSSSMTLDEYSKALSGNLKKIQDYNYVESSQTTLSGLPALAIVFTITRDKKLKIMQIFTVKGANAYLITYRSNPDTYQKMLPAVKKMADSFKLL